MEQIWVNIEIGLGNGLSPVHPHGIIWTNAELLTHWEDIFFFNKIQQFYLEKKN